MSRYRNRQREREELRSADPPVQYLSHRSHGQTLSSTSGQAELSFKKSTSEVKEEGTRKEEEEMGEEEEGTRKEEEGTRRRKKRWVRRKRGRGRRKRGREGGRGDG